MMVTVVRIVTNEYQLGVVVAAGMGIGDDHKGNLRSHFHIRFYNLDSFYLDYFMYNIARIFS